MTSNSCLKTCPKASPANVKNVYEPTHHGMHSENVIQRFLPTLVANTAVLMHASSDETSLLTYEGMGSD